MGRGRNAFGELGDGTTINSRTPVAVQAGGLSFGAGLSAGGEHTCAISGAGTAYEVDANSATNRSNRGISSATSMS